MAKKQEVQIDRREKKGERRAEDRRKENMAVVAERRQGEPFDEHLHPEVWHVPA